MQTTDKARRDDRGAIIAALIVSTIIAIAGLGATLCNIAAAQQGIY